MRCTVCYLEFEPDDAQQLDRKEKVQCPFCSSIIRTDEAEEASDAASDAVSDDDRIVEDRLCFEATGNLVAIYLRQIDIQ